VSWVEGLNDVVGARPKKLTPGASRSVGVEIDQRQFMAFLLHPVDARHGQVVVDTRANMVDEASTSHVVEVYRVAWARSSGG